MKLTVKQQVEVKYVDIDVAVRYADEDMAFDAPMRTSDSWRAVIDLDEKRVMDWPQGKTLSFKDMKVCDEGVYKLLDVSFNVLAEKQGYVPNNLLPGSYGDYLDMDIDENGYVKNWLPNANLSDFEERED